MKIRQKIVLLLIAILGHTNQGMSQHYASMLKEPARWHVTFCTEFTCFTDFYATQGDTTINGRKYRFLDEFHFNRAVVLREDTIQGKVYFRYLYGQRIHTDVLMYDYSLNTGDSIQVFNPNSPIPEDSLGPYMVVKVDSILTEKGQRKRLQLKRMDTSSNEFINTTWVEGVGNLSYINTPAVGPELYGRGELSCFAFNDTNFVYKSAFSKKQGECNIYIPSPVNGFNRARKKVESISIYPNPSKDVIHFKGLTQNTSRVEIHDQSGRLLMHSELKTNNLNVSNLKPGSYVLSVINDGRILHRLQIIKW